MSNRFNWDDHTECSICGTYGPLTRESCVLYASHFGYYSRETIDALWTENDDAQEFFYRYAELKHSDEKSEACACGNSTNFVHPWFGVTGGFGAVGACTCDGAEPAKEESHYDYKEKK